MFSRSCHAGLLVHGDEDFNGWVGNGGVLQQGHGIGHGDAVVAAQSGPTGKDKLVVVGQVQGLLGHIHGAVRVLLADHVHVALEQHRGVVLIAGGSRLEPENVPHRVLDDTNAVAFGKFFQIIADGFDIPGAMRNGA